jgi:aubergine-like protein
MKDVATITRITPEARAKTVDTFVKSVMSNPEAYKHLRDWGLSLEPTTLPLQARVMDPETLYFGKGKVERCTPKADWNRAATNSFVLTAVDLRKWAIIFWDKNKGAVQTFCKTMQMNAVKMGINIANPKICSLDNDRTDSYVKQLREILDPSVQLVLLVVPQMKADRYAAIKKLCCIEKPVPSQVSLL